MDDGCIVRVLMIGFLGLIAGLVVGAAFGLLIGIAWIQVFQTSDFEGYSATLVFFGFAPAGAIIGAIIGAVWGGVAASRARIHLEPDSW